MPRGNGRSRCAIYTRKSSEEGLDQEFNSLDSQREAGAAYVKSQAREGWRPVRSRYDDGGYSGGNLGRPGLARLLDDIKGGKIDIVVVYKVDRLTRSLRDFAKLIDVFEQYEVSFVSVTQQFNTTTSMGRLMLNVLLSFAQFEREVTGERIRDKIAASKKKGMWMGGVPPMGYRAKDRKLVVMESEAKVIREIFGKYCDARSISTVVRELDAAGIRTRRYTSARGRSSGGRPFSRGHVQRILVNEIYRGKIVHDGKSFAGEHPAIVDAGVWETAQALLRSNRNGEGGARVRSTSLFRGRVYDDAGNRMSPTQAKRAGRSYRYYTSQALIRNRRQAVGSVGRVSADEIDSLVVDAVQRWLGKNGRTEMSRVNDSECAPEIREIRERVMKVVVSRDVVLVDVALEPTSDDENRGNGEPPTTIRVPFDFVPKAGGTRIIAQGQGGATFAGRDPALIKAVARAHAWKRQLLSGEVKSLNALAKKLGLSRPYVSRIVHLASLAPDITEAILEGRQPINVTVDTLRDGIPLDWDEQRCVLGFSTK